MGVDVKSAGTARTLPERPTPEWWRSAVVYQIYPRSFYDSDGDGNGDLNGITQKVPYLKYLGVDAIWINPFFRSPGKDQGYDAASYHKVDLKFGGNNADMRRLIDTAHESDIRVILDLAINHTSNQHPWFLHALRPGIKERRLKSGYNSEVDPLANVYVFRPEDPTAPNKPPNNWKQFMGDQSAWTKVPMTGEWYLHKFTADQPDLDPRNPLVRSHISRIVHRWVGDQKIDGIRIDVLDRTFHDRYLRDFELLPNSDGNERTGHEAPYLALGEDVRPSLSADYGLYHLDGWNWQERWILSEAHELAREISEAVHSVNPNAVSIAELYYGDPVSDFRHLGHYFTKGQIDIPLNFSLLTTVWNFGADGREFKAVIDRYIQTLPEGACANFVLSNHDLPMRLVDRVGKENLRPITMMLLSLGHSGGSNILMYNGDEIGMEKGNRINESNMDDPIGKLQGLASSRDHVRTGMVWSAGKPNGGFSDHEPWLPGGETICGRGIEEQMIDRNSLLNFNRSFIHFRKENEALRFGKYIPYDSGDDAVFCFGREAVGQNLVMAFNFSGEPKTVRLPRNGEIVFSTNHSRTHAGVERRT